VNFKILIPHPTEKAYPPHPPENKRLFFFLGRKGLQESRSRGRGRGRCRGLIFGAGSPRSSHRRDSGRSKVRGNLLQHQEAKSSLSFVAAETYVTPEGRFELSSKVPSAPPFSLLTPPPAARELSTDRLHTNTIEPLLDLCRSTFAPRPPFSWIHLKIHLDFNRGYDILAL